MSEYERRSPLSTPLIVLAMVGGGWFFFQNFQIEGLDQVSVYQKNSLDDDQCVSFGDQPTFALPSTDSGFIRNSGHDSTLTSAVSDNPFRSNPSTNLASTPAISRAPALIGPGRTAKRRRERVENLRIGSWALEGFGNAKLSDDQVRRHLVRVIRQFDIVALQQITSIERDVVPLLVDAANGSNGSTENPRYDYVLGEPVGPADAREQLAFVFDTDRVRVDRSQTYTIADPEHQMSYDPLVAWFQANEPSIEDAWTFSLVNVRVDLGRAPSEVALLGAILQAVRRDGRGEDDVVMAGLLQADDEYLLPDVMGGDVRAAVRKSPTEIMGKHQTCNILVDIGPTNEFVGRGGALDFLRVYNLSLEEAKAVSTQLPVYAEFSATEGGFVR